MRISELSRQTDVPVATIKFYLRVGLLPEGERTSPTQAQYDEQHAARLRLIRALLGPGGLTVASAGEVLAAIDDPPASMHDLLGVACAATSPPVGPGLDHTRVHELMHSWGWRVDEKECDAHAALETALAALDAAEFALPPDALDLYADRMQSIAETEIASVPRESAAAAVSYVVLGTVLVEPLLLALRRMAQQELSGRRFGNSTPSTPTG
jgi:DNA-binding transcriptional MerR regulator